MGHPYWRLFDVVIRTPRLEVRYPDDSLLIELATVAAQGVHDPGDMPFLTPWTRAISPQLERSAFQHWWGHRVSWTPENWFFVGAVVVDGHAVGSKQPLTRRAFGSYPKLTVPVPVIIAKKPGGVGALLLVLHWPFLEPLE